MKNTIKLSMILALSSSLFAMSSIDKKVIDYQTNAIKQNTAYTLHSVKLDKKEKLDKDGVWNAYKLTLDLTQKSNNKRFQPPMIVFSNGRYISNEMVDMNTGSRYGEAEQRAEADKKRAKFEDTFTLPSDYFFTCSK